MHKEKMNLRKNADVETVENILINYGIVSTVDVNNKRQNRKNK